MAFGRLGSLGRGFGRLGAGIGSGADLPTAPVLAITSGSSDDTPEFTIDVDDTVAAGDSVRLQIQVSGGSWSSLVSDTTHVITSPEDSANEIALSLSSLPNGDYDARANVTHGGTSPWSNTVTFTISASTTAGQPIGLLLSLTKAA